MSHAPCLLAMPASRAWGEAVAAQLDTQLPPHEARGFDDEARGFDDEARSELASVADLIIGDVKDRCAIVIDERIGSGAALAHAARACRALGADEVHAAAISRMHSDASLTELLEA